MRNLYSLTFVVLVAASLGCQSDATAPDGPPDGGGLLNGLPEPTSLTVVPSSALIDGGRILKLAATLHYPNGSTSIVTDVTWESADDGIAAVTADGTVQGLRAGRVQVVAVWRNRRGSSLVTVQEPVVKKDPPRCIEPQTSGTGGSTPKPTACA
jgi:hypothetical protein